jgi:type IV secretory pathway TraG/TraD family ATPase VirD4
MLSALVTLGSIQIWRHFAPALQGYYLPAYARESLLPHFAFGKAAHKPKRYLAVYSGSNLATDETLATDSSRISVRPLFVERQQFTTWLRAAIYRGKSILQLVQTPLIASAVCLLLFLIAGIVFDTQRLTAFRRGRKLRGPDLLSPRQFNRRIRGDGLAFHLDGSSRGSQSFNRIKGKQLRLERRHEAQHIQIIGDPGSGKTQAIMQILDRAEAQEETAVIYDPHLEFAARYYRPERGDLIANPLDERCFSWCPTDEMDFSHSATAEATALAQAESLYPGRPADKDWFFIHTSRLIYKHLLVHHQPESARELGTWMQHPDPQIDMRVLGTELEQMLAINAAPQRAAVTSTLAQVAFALRQIPDKEPARQIWTVRDWCDKRQGWIFFTNTQDTRTALRPLQSLWIDMLIRRILSQGPRTDLKPVRLILDELPTLQMLPQLQSAMTESRKTGLSIVIGFQGRSQIKALYGEESETIFSAPFTKILLRTSEPEAADWSSKIVGETEVERPKETRPAHAFGKHHHHSFTTEVKTERLVLASQFSGLPDRCGYLRYANEVVPIKIAIVPERPKRPTFVPRRGLPVAKDKVPSLAEFRAKKKAEREEITAGSGEAGPQLLPRPHQPQRTS